MQMQTERLAETNTCAFHSIRFEKDLTESSNKNQCNGAGDEGTCLATWARPLGENQL